MTAKEIIKILEEKFPKNLAEEWDNVGLMLGDKNREIKKIIFALDITFDSLEFAKKNKVDMIITHHPFLFRGIKKIDFDEIIGKKIEFAIKNDILIYSMHTNLDSQIGGLNDYILKKLDVTESKILEKNDISGGIGRVFKLKEKIEFSKYIVELKEKLKLKKVKIVAPKEEMEISKIALVNGSAMSYWKKALKEKVDVFITGDVGYHDALDAKESGLCVVDIGHFESEYFFGEILTKILGEKVEVLEYQEKFLFEYR